MMHSLVSGKAVEVNVAPKRGLFPGHYSHCLLLGIKSRSVKNLVMAEGAAK